MPGELAAEGRVNTALFAELVGRFGWTPRGPLERNFTCYVCQHDGGALKTHGLDAFFTFQCPYAKRSRGVLFEGKRYLMDSVGGPTKLRDWLKDAVQKMVHIRGSFDRFVEARGLPPDTSVDTVLLAWDCHDGWDPEVGVRWSRQIEYGLHQNPPITGLVATRIHLDRLATLAAFRATVRELEFYYDGCWSPVLTPEVLFSAAAVIRYKPIDGDERFGAVYFDTIDPRSIRFLAVYMKNAGLLIPNNVDVFVRCRQLDVEQFSVHFRGALERGGWTVPRGITFNQLAPTLFES